jgi:hypothetical protein
MFKPGISNPFKEIEGAQVAYIVRKKKKKKKDDVYMPSAVR